MADLPADQDLADRYRRYNALCNAHDFAGLGEFVADDIRVNDQPTGLAACAAVGAGRRVRGRRLEGRSDHRGLGGQRPAGGAGPAER